MPHVKRRFMKKTILARDIRNGDNVLVKNGRETGTVIDAFTDLGISKYERCVSITIQYNDGSEKTWWMYRDDPFVKVIIPKTVREIVKE
jgi:hypothetical protein